MQCYTLDLEGSIPKSPILANTATLRDWKKAQSHSEWSDRGRWVGVVDPRHETQLQ